MYLFILPLVVGVLTSGFTSSTTTTPHVAVACTSGVEADRLVRLARNLAASPSGSFVRDSLRMVNVAEAEVELISADSICDVAAAAYRREMIAKGDSASLQELSDEVIVVRVGAQYLVKDPGVRYGEFGRVMLFSSGTFALRLSSFTG